MMIKFNVFCIHCKKEIAVDKQAMSVSEYKRAKRLLLEAHWLENPKCYKAELDLINTLVKRDN